MKIVITPDEKELDWFKKEFKKEKLVYENVIQVSLAGTLVRQKAFPAIFRQNIIKDPNELIGLLEALKEDLRDHKSKILQEALKEHNRKVIENANITRRQVDLD